jgi:hypothetical protein
MMPPTTTPSVGEARRHTEGHGYGLVLFASILLLVPDHHRDGRGRAVGAVRLRQPPESGR